MASACLSSASVDPGRNSPPHREVQFSKKKAGKGTEGSSYFFVGLSSCHCVGNQSAGVSTQWHYTYPTLMQSLQASSKPGHSALDCRIDTKFWSSSFFFAPPFFAFSFFLPFPTIPFALFSSLSPSFPPSSKTSLSFLLHHLAPTQNISSVEILFGNTSMCIYEPLRFFGSSWTQPALSTGLFLLHEIEFQVLLT